MTTTAIAEKLSKLHASERLGGKGTPRRKVKKSSKGSATSSAASLENDKKIASALKKVNAQMIPGLEEVNLFKQDGNIIHVAKPTGIFCVLWFGSLATFVSLVQASVPCSTFCITGHAEEKSLEAMLPGILNQLGADSIANLRRIAESFKPAPLSRMEADDEEVPELVESFGSKVSV
jgi:nascent polypeptide-associated complex subunit beta